MDPITISGLVATFLTAAVTSVGSGVGTRIVEAIFPNLEASGTQQVLAPFTGAAPLTPESSSALERVLVTQLRSDPAFAARLGQALNAEMRHNPTAASRAIVNVQQRRPGLVESLFGLSPEHATAHSGRCPIGGHFLLLPKYFDGYGRSLGLPLFFGQMPKSAVAQCRNGHEWPVFAVRT